MGSVLKENKLNQKDEKIETMSDVTSISGVGENSIVLLSPNETSTNSVSSQGYVSRLNINGEVEQVCIDFNDDSVIPLDDGFPNSITDFVSSDILAKPFNFVIGSSKQARFSPFRKKAGILNVLARQAIRNRIVAKNGAINTLSLAEGKEMHFIKDFFVSALELRWITTFLLFAATFLTSWFLFAVGWYLIFFQHGDFDAANKNNTDFIPCVSAIEDFTSCFLFSIETQHTIGYGGRATTEQCPVAIFMMSFQSIIGVIIQACMSGVVFAKFTVPTARAETLTFSKNALITIRNGALCLLIRVADFRKRSLLEAHVRMVIIRKVTTDEGEEIPFQISDLECGSELDGTNERVLLFWPVTITHVIDSKSPFYSMGPSQILNESFELVITLEGITEETGNTVQVRTSFLPNEILWGHTFQENCVNYDKKIGSFVIMHNLMNRTIVNNTPRCSAKHLDLKRKKKISNNSSTASSACPE